jgi:uncharacterized membrane protein
MRKIAEFVSIAALAALALIAVNALHGPQHLPDKIPVHFDAAGQPNGWDSSKALLFLPGMGAGLYVLLTVIARFPSLFNYPVTATDANRARLETLAQSLLAWIKAEILTMFVWLEFAWVQSIRTSSHAFGLMPVVIFLAIVIATVICHIAAMVQARNMQ